MENENFNSMSTNNPLMESKAKEYADSQGYQSDKEQYTTTPWVEFDNYYDGYLAGRTVGIEDNEKKDKRIEELEKENSDLEMIFHENLQNSENSRLINIGKLSEKQSRITELESLMSLEFEKSKGKLEEIQKMEELIEAQGEYILFLTHHYRDMFSLAAVHGYVPSKEDVDKGIEFRKNIKSIEKSLTP